MVEYLLLGMTYGFAAGAQPGQLQAYLVNRAVAHGWRSTLPAAFAPVLSDAPIVALVVFVLARVPAGFLRALQFGGGLFLLYLAWTTIRAPRGSIASPPHSPARTLVSAATLNLLNPNPYIAWSLVLGPLLIEAWRQTPGRAVALVAAFYLTMVAVSAAIVLVFASTRAFGARGARALVILSALALAGFGAWQLYAATIPPRH